MSALDNLPADQRAVLELVLGRKRNYDDIASMLAIDRAGVRQRALAALDTMAPSNDVAPERRALIADYLLGQLPPRVSDDVRSRLSRSPSDRRWAHAVASELSALALEPLPEIPATSEDGAHAQASQADAGPTRRLSRRNPRLLGAILLGGATLVVAAVVLIAIFVGSGSDKAKTTAAGSTLKGTNTASATSASSAPQTLATVRMSPVNPASKAQGFAEAFSESGRQYLAIVAINLAPNSHNYYAVWLAGNSPSDSKLVGIEQSPVTGNGRLQAFAPLPPGASRYTQVLLTLETSTNVRTPGTVVLSGPLSFK